MINYTKLFRIILFVLFSFTAILGGNRVKGRVIEKRSGKPIPFVNVYLKNTTVGASTDAKGFYIIEKAPRGKYEIIASAIGYNFEKKNVEVSDNRTVIVDFRLAEKAYELGEIQVEADVNEEWQENYDIFRREFLGNSRNASQCIIKNPYQLEFERKGHWLYVTSPRPVEVINEALGYKIEVELKLFRANLHNDDISFIIHPYYIPMKSDDVEKKKMWNINRDRAYYGSSIHFLRCLAEENAFESGFLMMPREEADPRDAKMDDKIFYDNIEKQDIVFRQVLDTVSAVERSLKVDKFLQIVYKNEKEESNYLNSAIGKRFGGNRINGIQTSWMRLPMGKLYFDITGARGEFNAQLDILGYWGWERLADLVPENYVPTKN